MRDEIEDIDTDLDQLFEELNIVKNDSRQTNEALKGVINCTKTCKDMKQLRDCIERINP